jgi:hypothetical protein
MRESIVFALTLLAVFPALAETIDVTAVPLEAPGDPSASVVGELEYVAAFELVSESLRWGGISGASVAADGSVLTLVSDTGLWHRLTLQHDEVGRLVGLAVSETGQFNDEEGKPLKRKGWRDAEAVARGADGSYYVAFEGRHRLWRYQPASDPLRAQAEEVRPPQDLRRLPPNEGLEAVAVLPGGRFLLLSEGGRTGSGDLRGWLGNDDQWSEISLVPTEAFKPTDLDVLPTGDLLLLERSLSLFGGFTARLSVIPTATIAPDARLVTRELAVLSKPLPVDNFEAAAARRASDGSTLIYVLSDDNFTVLQRTLLLQFRWQPD